MPILDMSIARIPLAHFVISGSPGCFGLHGQKPKVQLMEFSRSRSVSVTTITTARRIIRLRLEAIIMAKTKPVPVSVPKSRETIESDVEMNSDNLDEQSSSVESSSEESSSSDEGEGDDVQQNPAGSSTKPAGGKKNGKWP